MSSEGAIAGPLVLVVEDEPQVMRFLRTGLVAQNYRVIEAGTGKLAMQLAAQHVPDIALLDLGLPDIDGLEVTRGIRAWSALPILVLSARGQEGAKVEALDAGADDYLTKPFSFPELLARMRAALRRAARVRAAKPDAVIAVGSLRIDLERREVTIGDRSIHLTPTEFKLLSVLARHPGKVMTHRQLLELVWGPKTSTDAGYLRVYMTHLRRKLERGGDGARVFETEAGVGYRLRALDE